jgi:hypothetical protein
VRAVAGVSGAVEAPRSRTDIAVSFAPVMRDAAPEVIDIDTREQQGRAAANPFSWDPFCRIFFPECGGASPNDVPENPPKRPLPWRSNTARAGRKLAVVIGG